MNSQTQALARGFSLGHYEVRAVRELSDVGIEYLAHDHESGKEIALQEFLPESIAVRKDACAIEPILPQNAAQFDTMVGAFLEEAAALAQCDFPNINAIRGAFRANGTGYVVSDIPLGTSLKEILDREGAIQGEALTLLLPCLLDGLGKLHEAGLLHLDIRPANITLKDDGSSILRGVGAVPMSLGSARQSFSERRWNRQIVSERSVYAPIELYSENTAPGPWSDIYSLGATLYHCVTGSPPPSATDRVLEDSLALSANNSTVGIDSKTLSAIMAAMAIVPTARPRSVAIWKDQFFGGSAARIHSTTDARFARASARGGRLSPKARVAKSAGSGNAPSGAFRWAVPGLALTAATAAIAFIDVGVLRPELDLNDVEPSLVHLSMAGRTEALTYDAAPTPQAAPAPDAEPPADQPVAARNADVDEAETTPADEPLATAKTDAILIVETTPPNVEVLLAGQAVGHTPLRLPGLPSGAHDITLRHPHYETVEMPGQQLVAAEELRIETTLQRGFGNLLITTDPPGAWVEMDDDRVIESTPGTLRSLPAGYVNLRLGAPGHAIMRVAAEVPRGGTGYLAHILPAAYGTLDVDLEPADALVVVFNDADIAYRYTPGMQLPQGTYRMEVSKQGYSEATRNVNIDGETNIKVELRPRS